MPLFRKHEKSNFVSCLPAHILTTRLYDEYLELVENRHISS